MSPEARPGIYCPYYFPRVSGDEPRIVPIQYGSTRFSPRERG